MMDEVQFQADADLNQDIVTGVLRRQPSISVQTAYAAQLKGGQDADVLAIFACQKRILVIHDSRTMPTECANFILHTQHSGTLIVSRKTSLEIVIEELILIWSLTTADKWTNRIANIPL